MGYPNGKYPEKALATTYLYYPGTGNGRRILKEVQPYAEAMATAFYRRFGKPLFATDGYRDYATQVRLKKEKGPYAAAPGTSVHGLGRAFDLASGVQNFGTPEHKWLRENAHRWGFVHPTWAHDGNPANGMDEAWHWEFVGGGTKTPRVERPRLFSKWGLGAKGDHVRGLQQQLRDAGQDVVVDGDYGLGTAVNVLVFQEKNGLKRHGKADVATRRALAGKRPAKPSTPAPTKPNPLSVKDKVQRIQGAVHATQDGVWGPDTSRRVGALETAARYGRFPFGQSVAQDVVGVVRDGLWGPKSAAALDSTVRRVQAVLGVTADGVWGPKTSAALADLEKRSKGK